MMSSKRAAADAKSAATEKRTKRDDNEGIVERERAYELELGGEVFIDVDKLFQFKSFQPYFKKKYNRSAKTFIENEHLRVVFVSNKNVDKRELKIKTTYSTKFGCRLVKKDEHVERLIKFVHESLLPEAPPVIEHDDLKFFVGKNGKSYQVEMCGTRTKNGIYFEAKDVARVFENERFQTGFPLRFLCDAKLHGACE